VYFTVHADGTITWQNNTVQPGDRLTLDNQVGQAPRTIGYWKNHASFNSSNGGQAFVLDQMLAKLTESGATLTIGIRTLPGDAGNLATSVKYAFYLLDKRTIDGKNTKMASDARWNVAAQMVAYGVNQPFGAWPSSIARQAFDFANNILAAVKFDGTAACAKTKLSALQIAQLNYCAKILDAYNNGTLIITEFNPPV